MEIPSQILIIRLSSIGDILLTFPLIQALHREYPGTAIDFIVGKDYEDVLKPVRSLLRQVISYDKKNGRSETRRIRKIIRENRYPLIADLHNNLRTFRLTRRQSAAVSRFKKYRIRRFLYVKWNWQLFPETPVRQKYMQILPLLFQDIGFQPLDFQPETGIVNRLKTDIPVLASKNQCVLIYPGARHFTKRWPLEYYERLMSLILKKTNYLILLGGSKDESTTIQPLAKLDKSRIIDTSGKYSLYENFILVSLCDLIISNDSAPMHMATLLGKPQIAIFGNTVRQFGFYPENPGAVIMEDNTIPCRPCSHIGFDKCPKKHFDCMRKITPEMVFAKVK
ncbi:MAG: glycosyltransferase family 9 protein [Candidatus Marinimicrobia bacterium]|nr:glycosyltransferase family 9 protein [Candidatus Neomarinimicrobiota bacterium]